jgi:hypothetical protein
MRGLTINKSRAIPRENLIREEHPRFKILFFVIWPFVSFIHSLFELRSRSSWLIIVLFYGLCGFFYPFSFEGNFDVVRHANRFMEAVNEPFSVFFGRLTDLYTSDVYKPDLLQPLIEFIVSRVTDDYRFYFTALAMVMAFFLVKFVGTVARQTTGKDFSNEVIIWCVLLLVLILVPPYRLSGFRQVTAMLVFCYGGYRAVVLGESRYHWLVISACLIHFSFLGLLPFYGIYFLVGNRVWFYFLMIGAAFYLSDAAAITLGDFAVSMEGQLGQRLRGYSSADYKEFMSTLVQQRNFFIVNQLRYTAWFFFALQLGYFLLRRKHFTPAMNAFYCLTLSIFSFVILMKGIETSFLRFALLYIVFSAALTAHLFATFNRPLILVRLLLYAVVLMNLVIMTRKTIEFTGIQVLSPNVAIVFFLDTGDSILDWFK